MFHPQIVTEIINQVSTKQRTDTIFNYSKKHYDLHQFNVGSLYPRDVKKMNQSLKRRYKHQQIEILPTNWNQGERRLFVWFIICFLYERKYQLEDITQKDLQMLSNIFYGKDTIFLDFQLRNLPKVTKSKRGWNPEEDELLRSAINSLKSENDDARLFNNWNDVAKIIFFKTERRIFRTPKSCRQRWYNHLDESKKKDEFTVEEDLILLNYILTQSKSWSKIVKVLNYSRTQHRIKNRYYTLLRKYQRSFGGNQDQMNEENQRQIVIKLKSMLQSIQQNNGQTIQMFEDKPKAQPSKVKMQDEFQKVDNYGDEKGQNQLQSHSNDESKKLKIQDQEKQVQSTQKVKIVQQQDIEPKSSHSEAQLKENSSPSVHTLEDQQMEQKDTVRWQDNFMPFNQYFYQMNIPYGMNQPVHNMQAPIIINQFYCPIILQNGQQYQMYYQN